MIVIDTSAVVACLAEEAEAPELAKRIALARRRLISSVNLLESRLVLVFSKGIPAEIVDDFLANEHIEVVPFDQPLSELAFDAYAISAKVATLPS